MEINISINIIKGMESKQKLFYLLSINNKYCILDILYIFAFHVHPENIFAPFNFP